MTQEEKAKAYDEALALMQDCKQDEFGLVHVRPYEIFPELRESEDEKIRNEIIESMRHQIDRFSDAPNVQKKYEYWIAWLEKQAPVEHFELKRGHWYMCHRAYCCRADYLTVQEGERFECKEDGVVKGFVIKDPEKYFIEVHAPAPMEDDQNDEVRRRSTIQVLEYAKSLDAYNQYGKADIDKNIAWLEKQSKVEQAMREVEEKAEAFTQAHKGETSDEILAQMRGEGWSEDDSEDERIRETLIELITWASSYSASGITTDEAKEMIAWLEKQGEQKSIWHSADETPKGDFDKEILVQFADSHASVLEISDWEYLDYQTKWAYLEDLKGE